MNFEMIRNFITDVRDRQRIAIALGKGAVALQNRRISLSDPATWEFSAFSQNGEDGILHLLRSQLRRSNRYFAEIAAADGVPHEERLFPPTVLSIRSPSLSGSLFADAPVGVQKPKMNGSPAT